MRSFSNSQKRPSLLFEAILRENGLDVPDGRMLFKYAISSGLLEELCLVMVPGTYCASCVQRGDRSACALWVFRLCSAWSEHYFDGSWSWDQTLRQAGLSEFEGDYKAFTSIGLNHWRVHREEYRGEYQKAIVRHAGLPRKRVLEGDGYLYHLVRRVVLDNSDRDILSESSALEHIRRAAIVVNLPQSFRKDAFLKSLAELSSIIHRAIVHADNSQANDAIRTLYPQFKQNEIDTLLHLQTRIITDAKEKAGNRPFRLRVLRLIEVIGDLASPLIKIEIGKTCQTRAIAVLFALGESLRNHYTVVAHNGFSRVVIADLRRVDAEQWDIRQHAQYLPRNWFIDPVNIVIERDGAEIVCLNHYSLEAPDISSDLVFSLYDRQADDSASFVLELGCPNAIDTEEFVIGINSTSQWTVHHLEAERVSAEAGDDAAEVTTKYFSELEWFQEYLSNVRFIRFYKCLVEVSGFSPQSQYYFSSSDRNDRYRFVGQSYRTASEHTVTRGIPRLYRMHSNGAMEHFDPFTQPRLEVYWKPLGQKPIQLIRFDEMEIYGPGYLEIFTTVSLPSRSVSGRSVRSLVLRQPFTIIPSISSVKRTEVDGLLSIHLVKWPIDDIDLILTGNQHISVLHCLDLNEDEDTYIIFNDDCELLDEYSFRLTWSNNTVSEECFSTPVDRCEIKVGNHPARQAQADVAVKIDLEELVYTQFSIKTPRIDDSVRLVLCGLDEDDQKTIRRLWHFAHRDVIKKDSFNLTIRLTSLVDRVRQQLLLCQSRNPKVLLEIQTPATTQVQGSYQTVARCEIIQSRVDAVVDWVEGILSFRNGKVGAYERQVGGDTCTAMAINLARPEDLPREIGTLSFGSQSKLPAHLNPVAIWFVYPSKDSENSFAPALYAGPAARGINLADFTTDILQRAILTSDADLRASLFDDYLMDLERRMRGRDPRQLIYWKRLVRQCEQLDHIDSCYFDLFNALARRPALLALLIVLEKERLSKFSESAHKSLKINWLLMGLNDWLFFMECFCIALKVDLKPYLDMKSLVVGALDEKQEDIRQVLWNLPSSSSTFFRALLDLMFDKHFLPGERLLNNGQRTLKILKVDPTWYLASKQSQELPVNEDKVADGIDLSEQEQLARARDSMPCSTLDAGTITTLADPNGKLAFKEVFINVDESMASGKSFGHRDFFRLLASQSMLSDQKIWRRWIESQFGVIQYTFHRHTADVVTILDECLLIQLSHYYHDLKYKGNRH